MYRPHVSFDEPTDRQVLIEMFKLYRKMRCLWDTDHEDFRNREIRSAALNNLLEVYHRFDQTATVGTLNKKINYYKKKYLTEWEKVEASKSKPNEPIYTPRIWYYEALSFLAPDVQHVVITNECIEIEDSETSSHEYTEPTTSGAGREEEMPKESFSINREEWEIIGKSIAIQLRDISGQQLIITQKLINDAICYAKMGLLSSNSYIVYGDNQTQRNMPSTSRDGEIRPARVALRHRAFSTAQ